MSVTLIIGTDKGAYVLRSKNRDNWAIEGPLFKGWRVTAVGRASNGDFLLGVGSMVYGAAVQRSSDLKNWKQAAASPVYPEGGGRKLDQIWRFTAANGRLWAGVAEAGLFSSEDHGDTWRPVPGLNEHATRGAWQPGAGGLCCHAVLVDHGDPRRMWCGISAVGTFRSDDGGETWNPCNRGVPVILEDKNHPEVGYCVHALQQDPRTPDRLYRQDHLGMFRSIDGGRSWERNESGLPSGFGFPLGIDRSTAALFAAPLESDEYRLPLGGKLQIFRSDDLGDSWSSSSAGLPGEHYYAGVLRSSLDTDRLDPCGVYFGTTSGDLFWSTDAGNSWRALPARFARVLCVGVVDCD